MTPEEYLLEAGWAHYPPNPHRAWAEWWKWLSPSDPIEGTRLSTDRAVAVQVELDRRRLCFVMGRREGEHG